MTMMPHASLVRDARFSNICIKLADGSVLNSNIKRGYLDAACNGKLLPNITALSVTLVQRSIEGLLFLRSSVRFRLPAVTCNKVFCGSFG